MAAQETVDRLIEAINDHDLARIASCYGKGARVWDPFYPEALEGWAIVQDYLDLFTAFPDVELRPRTVLGDEDAIANEVLLVAGGAGSLLRWTSSGVEGAVKPLRLQAGIFTSVDRCGLVVEERRYYDVDCLLEQLHGRHLAPAVEAPLVETLMR